MNKKNIVLVTGGAGYIGVVLVETLVKNGYVVRVFDKLYFGRKVLDSLKNKIELIEGDIRNVPENIFNNVNIVIHLAALSNDPTAEFNPKANFEINTKATISLAKKAKEAGVRRFIFGSSASIYDMGMIDGEDVKTEKSKVSPHYPYALSKRNAEKGILKLANDKFIVVILRKGTVFGFSSRMRYDLVINAMIKSALQDKEIKIYNRGIQWRPLVAIEDVVGAYEKAILAPSQRVNKQIFNIVLGNYLVIDLAIKIKNIFEKEFNKKIKIIYSEGDKNDRSYSISGRKAKKTLSFIPKTGIDKSVVNIIKKIKTKKYTNFNDSIYYNIAQMKQILEKE